MDQKDKKIRICQDCNKESKTYLTRNRCITCYNRLLKKMNPEYRKKCNKQTLEWDRSPHGQAKRFATRIKHRYNLTVDEYNNMLNKQENKCLICIKEFKSRKLTYIDHCHKTKIVRGLLCARCNTTVGYYEKTLDIRERVLEYINSSNLEQMILKPEFDNRYKIPKKAQKRIKRKK